jgi:aspartate racemase
MKVLGIISGMGTRAGLLFANKMVDYLDVTSDQDFPEFLLHNNSKVPDRTKAIFEVGESPIEELRRSIRILNEGNADVIVATCITAYHFIADLEGESKAKILNPITLVRDHILQYYRDTIRVGLLCTSGTLRSELFQRSFDNTGVELITLGKGDQQNLFMRSVYMENGFKSSRVSKEAGELMNAAVDSLLREGVELIIGGCSEVQLCLSRETMAIPYIDTMDVLAKAALSEICDQSFS